MVTDNGSIKEVAARFNIAASTLYRWKRQQKWEELLAPGIEGDQQETALEVQVVEPNPDSIGLGTLRPEFASAILIEELKAKVARVEAERDEALEETALLRAVCMHFFKKANPRR